MSLGNALMEKLESLLPFLIPVFAAIITFSLVNMWTGGLFLLMEIGITVGVYVFCRRLMRG